MLPDKRNVEEAAIELGVDPAFIEKDWYAVQVLKAISEFSHLHITPIFVENLTLPQNQMEVGSNYFKVLVFYENQFDIPDTLRKGLQIEFSYTQPRNSTESRPIDTIIAELTKSSDQTTLPCLSCLETAANKFSAFNLACNQT